MLRGGNTSVTTVLLNSFGGRLLPRRAHAPEAVADAAAARDEVPPRVADSGAAAS